MLKTKTTINKRDSNIELLRIFAMFLIVLHHFSRHISYEVSFESVSLNSVYNDVISIGGNVGVIIFVLITGYYSTQKRFSSKRIFAVLFQLTFYNILLGVVSVICGAEEFRLKLIPRILFSFIFNGTEYWFVNAYLLLLLLIPILNIAIEKINKNHLLLLIIVFFSIWCFFPFTIGKVIKLTETFYSILGLFVLTFFIGSYLRKYCITDNNKIIIGFLFIFSWLIFIFSVIVKSVYQPEGIIGIVVDLFSQSDKSSFMTIIVSLFTFLFFKSIHIKNSIVINTIGKATFGVYLCHNNEMFRKYMWYEILGITKYAFSRSFIIASILITVIIFAICTIIDIARYILIEKSILRIDFLQKILSKIDCSLN